MHFARAQTLMLASLASSPGRPVIDWSSLMLVLVRSLALAMFQADLWVYRSSKMTSNVTYRPFYRCTAWLTQCHWMASPIVCCLDRVLKCKSHIASWDNTVTKNTNSGNLPPLQRVQRRHCHRPIDRADQWGRAHFVFSLELRHDPEHLFDGEWVKYTSVTWGRFFLFYCVCISTAAHRVCVYTRSSIFSVLTHWNTLIFIGQGFLCEKQL